jgi:hypothetical protein
LFRLADASVINHKDERRDKTDMLDMESVYSEAFDRYGIDCSVLIQNMRDVNMLGGRDDDDDSNSGGDRLETINEDDEHKFEEEQVDEADVTTVPTAGKLLRESVAKSFPTSQACDVERERVHDDEEPEVHIVGFESKPSKKGSRTQPNIEKVKGKHQQQLPRKLVSVPKDNVQVNPPSKLPSEGSLASTPNSKKPGKKLSKRAARKYADQDDEDRELAMIALGHKKPMMTAKNGTDPDQTTAHKTAEEADNKVIERLAIKFDGV